MAVKNRTLASINSAWHAQLGALHSDIDCRACVVSTPPPETTSALEEHPLHIGSGELQGLS
jgi:hypothetical protein